MRRGRISAASRSQLQRGRGRLSPSTQIAVAEVTGRAACQSCRNAFSDEGTLLLRHRRETRQGLSPCILHDSRIADHENLGVMGQRQIRFHPNAPGRIMPRTQPGCRWRSRHPSRPHDCGRRDGLLGHDHASSRAISYRDPSRTSTPNA